MSRHPIQNDCQPRAMALVDELRELGGRSIPGGRRVHPQRLIAPRATKRMFGDRHQFYMRETHGHRIADQTAPNGRPGAALLVATQPRPKVHLINRHGRIWLLPGAARGHPFIIGPVEVAGLGDDRRRCRRFFGTPGQRIRLQRQKSPIRAVQLVFIPVPRNDTGDEHFPHPALRPKMHGVTLPIPTIEIAHDRNPARIRRPNRKPDPLRAVCGHRMRPQAVCQIPVPAFGNKVQVQLSQQRPAMIGGTTCHGGPSRLLGIVHHACRPCSCPAAPVSIRRAARNSPASGMPIQSGR